MSMLTLSACIEQTTTNANGVEIIHKRRLSATNSSYTLQINASNQAVFSVTNQVPVAVYSRGNTNLPNNQRNHIAGVYDGSKMYVYQNGVNENTNGWNQTGSVFDSDGPMTTDYYSQFSGTIHDARVYDRALSVAEIQELSDTCRGTTTATNPPADIPPPTPPADTTPPPPSPTPVNGQCSTTLNTCTTGTFTDTTDTSSTYLWSCTGSNGGTTASCTLPIPIQQSQTPPTGPTITVKKDGTGTYTTIQACAAVVQPGQTCLVYPGVYDERVSVVNGGTSGNPVTFRAAGGVIMRGFTVLGKNSITIDGFEITGAMPNDAGISIARSSSVSVLNNNLHHTTGGIYATGISLSAAPNTRIIGNRISNIQGMGGIRMGCNTSADFSDNTIIRGNTISYISINGSSSGPGISLCGNGVLSENNDISHVADFTTVGSNGSAGYVIRNNEFHDVVVSDWATSPHIDGVQGYGSRMLVENNYMHDVSETDKNVHFVLFGGERGGSHGIVRYNAVRDIDSAFSDGQYGFSEMKVYNNTLARTSRGVGIYNTAVTFGNGTGAVVGGTVLNNVFFDAAPGLISYAFIRDSLTNARADYNVLYKSSCGTGCGPWNRAYPVPPQADAHGIINTDPLLVDTTSRNFSLQPSSPAIDHGGPLTTATNAGSNATMLRVGDAGPFQDGWAGVQHDWISVGATGNYSEIASIDYTTNTITLRTPLTWSVNAPIYLFKDSTGRQVLYGSAPDIGAFEYGSGTLTTVPTQPTTPAPPVTPALGDFNRDGLVNSVDFSLLISAWNQPSTTYDLNGDGLVNTLDYAIMAQHWSR
jgi:hypothetical protein